MCNACGFPAAPGAWTEAGAVSPGDRMRARMSQAATLNRLLEGHGLRAADAGAVPGIQLSRLTGERVLCRDLPALWKEAERMLGRPVDPLAEPVANGRHRRCG